jgi:hypothetical protein
MLFDTQLKQVLCILYLIRSTSDGDDTVTSTIRCIVQLHIGTRLLSDALYVLSTFTNDYASQIRWYADLLSSARTRRGTAETSQTETLNIQQFSVQKGLELYNDSKYSVSIIIASSFSPFLTKYGPK